MLFGDRTMRGIMTGLGGIVGGSVAGLDADALGSFRAIGIELDATNQLEIDDAKLDNALLTKLDDVRDTKAPSFDEVKPNLVQRAQGLLVEKHISDLRAKASIK